MNTKTIIIGFLLFFGSTYAANTIIVPQTQSALMPLFGWAGLYAGLAFSSTVGFFVLIAFFAIAHKLHIDGEIPEVG